MSFRPDNLDDLLTELEDHYRDWQAEAELDERMYDQRYASLFKFDYDVDIYQSSTATDIVDTYRNHVRTADPSVMFTPFGSSREADERASQMRRWCEAMLRLQR